MILFAVYSSISRRIKNRLEDFRRIFLIILIIFSQVNAQTQSLHINLSQDNTDTFNLETIRKITVTDDLMNLVLWNGTTYSWNLTSVTKLSYNNLILGSMNLNEKIDVVDFSIYPNPTSSDISLHFSTRKSDEISIQLLDLKGSVISERNLGVLLPGAHLETISLGNIAAGNYVIRLISQSNFVSKIIIKN